MPSRVAVRRLFLSIVWCLGAVTAAAAQDTTVRLEGAGRLGAAADEYRGTSAAYGYEGTPLSVVPEMIGLAGIGVLWLPRYMADAHVATGELQALFEDWQLAPMPLYLAYRPNPHVSARLRVFIDWVAALLARQLPR